MLDVADAYFRLLMEDTRVGDGGMRHKISDFYLLLCFVMYHEWGTIVQYMVL
jgi:hypothetical protein